MITTSEKLQGLFADMSQFGCGDTIKDRQNGEEFVVEKFGEASLGRTWTVGHGHSIVRVSALLRPVGAGRARWVGIASIRHGFERVES